MYAHGSHSPLPADFFALPAGSVYPPKIPSGFKLPEGLPQKPELDYHVHPAVFPHLPQE